MSISKFKLDIASSNDYKNDYLDIPLKDNIKQDIQHISNQRKIINLEVKNKNIINILSEIKDDHQLSTFNLESCQFFLSTYHNYSTDLTSFFENDNKLPNPKFIIFFYQYVQNITEETKFIFDNGQIIKPITGTVIFFNSKEKFKIKEILVGFSTVIIIKFY